MAARSAVSVTNPRTLKINHIRLSQIAILRFFRTSQNAFSKAGVSNESKGKEEEEFRPYEIEGLKPAAARTRMARSKKRIPPPRYKSMSTDADWTDMWPTASTFNWSAVPFPVRQGFIESSSENEGVVPSKYANLELMKIPNFLHLTPSHVKKHCNAIKGFCTQWPKGLETDEKCKKHFPLESVTSDYVGASPTINDERARVVTLKFKLSDLDLNHHARDKFIRLLENKYDATTDEVTLESDRCPLRSQNMDFLQYVMTALYFESWKTEGWESLKTLGDMEKYMWDLNASRQSTLSLLREIKSIDDATTTSESNLNYLPADMSDDDSLCQLKEVEQYKLTVEDLFNEGENIDTINNYKKAVKELLGIQGHVS